VLTLHNPPQNFLPDPVFVEKNRLAKWLSDENLKGVVVTGTGRHFCGGAEPKALTKARDNPDLLKERLTLGREVLHIVKTALVPTVAAIRGACLGAGWEIALACLFRVAAPGTVFGFPETGLGLVPGLGGVERLAALLPRARAAEIVLTGETLDAEAALAAGLVDHISPDPLDQAFSLLDRLTAHLHPSVIHAVLEVLPSSSKGPVSHAREAEIFVTLARRYGQEEP
jgi:enoyl-CoA hydratase/carnithine racemase